MVAGVRRALAEPSDVIVVLPADAPLGGQAAGTLLRRLESEPRTEAVVGVDADGREQPLQLALRPPAARALVAAAGPGGAAGVSARRLLDARRPGLLTQELPPAGSSDVKITGRATLRTAPTTTTTACSGNEASVRSSSGLPSTCSASLSGAKRCDVPPASTTAVRRRDEGCLLVKAQGRCRSAPSQQRCRVEF